MGEKELLFKNPYILPKTTAINLKQKTKIHSQMKIAKHTNANLRRRFWLSLYSFSLFAKYFDFLGKCF